jgi:hypothetical protein
MKTYFYDKQTEINRIEKDVVVECTEKEILDEYWDFWYTAMVKKFGKGHELITEQNCIKDWMVVHWAGENKNET